MSCALAPIGNPGKSTYLPAACYTMSNDEKTSYHHFLSVLHLRMMMSMTPLTYDQITMKDYGYHESRTLEGKQIIQYETNDIT